MKIECTGTRFKNTYYTDASCTEESVGFMDWPLEKCSEIFGGYDKFSCGHAANPFEVSALSPVFKKFKKKFNKIYSTAEEESYRLGIFASNLEKISSLNEMEGATFGITEFTDLTVDEFRSKKMGYVKSSSPVYDLDRIELPEATAESVDWRSKGVLTPIKDQGNCGSCWAFSATEAVESFAKLAGNPLRKLSPQQTVSCDKRDGACQGGDTSTAYQYMINAGGLESGSSYPYTSGRTDSRGRCDFEKSDVVQQVRGYTRVREGEQNLASALQKGPVSICLAAENWQNYHGGVMTNAQCGNGGVDHCVQAVGYTSDYWIVRNQWGTSFGEDGYIRIARGSNACKISNEITYPTF
jgi:cathepsin F